MIGTIRAPLVVIGATGLVGRGVVAAAAAAGWPVIAVARRAAELATLREATPGADLATLTGSVGTDEEAARLAAQVQGLGRPIGGVVVAVSSCSNRGSLLAQATQALVCRMETDLFPQLAAARAFLPLLVQANRGGSYVVVGGPGSDRPWAGYGHRSIAAAALRMLAHVLHAEARPLGVRVHLLSVDAPVRADGRDACPQWPTALDIGRQALALVQTAATKGPTRAVVPFVARPAETVPSAAAGTDAGDGLLTERWLQDTRTLLATIAPGGEPAARATGGSGAARPDAACPDTARPDTARPARVRAADTFVSPSDPHKEASP